jgi:hypothetical protein
MTSPLELSLFHLEGLFAKLFWLLSKGPKGKTLATFVWRSILWHGVNTLKFQQNMHLVKTS